MSAPQDLGNAGWYSTENEQQNEQLGNQSEEDRADAPLNEAQDPISQNSQTSSHQIKLKWTSSKDMEAEKADQRRYAFNLAFAQGRFTPKLAQVEETAYARRICVAIRSTDAIQGEVTAKRRPRLSASRISNKQLYTDSDIETVAWRVLERTKDAFTIGVIEARHKIEREYYNSFTEHMDAVVAGLRESKDIVKRLLDPIALDKFVEQPKKELKNKRQLQDQYKEESAAKKRPGAVSSQTTDRGQSPASASGPGRYFTPAYQADNPTSTSQSGYNQHGPVNLDVLKTNFKSMICDLLMVGRDMANQYSLEDLRLYARAVNLDRGDFLWQDPRAWELKLLGKGLTLIDTSGQREPIWHFAFVIVHFLQLGLRRGCDILISPRPDAVIYEPPAVPVPGFTLEENSNHGVLTQALGFSDYRERLVHYCQHTNRNAG